MCSEQESQKLKRTDTKLLIMLGIIIMFAVLLTFVGIKGVEHLILKNHAQEITNRWTTTLVGSFTKKSYSRDLEIDDFFPHQELLDKISMAAGIVSLKVIGRKKNVLLSYASQKENVLISHFFWNYVLSSKPTYKQGTSFVLAAKTPLVLDGANFGTVRVLVDLTAEIQHTAKMGTWIFLSMLGIYGLASITSGFLIIRNTRLRREIMHELVLATNAADKANQSKSMFIANVSHELRSPLNAINGFSEVMKNEMFGSMDNAKYLEYSIDIHASGTLLLTLINDILDLSKAESEKIEIKFETIEISDLTARVKRMVIERAHKADLTFRIDISEACTSVEADAQKLLQVLLNLCTNAIKFSLSGGAVELRVRPLGEDHIIFTVKDNGIGIAPSDINRALEPFVQVHTSQFSHIEGTGLGLPLSKRLVEKHGGTLEIESELGEGTTVKVTLPKSHTRL